MTNTNIVKALLKEFTFSDNSSVTTRASKITTNKDNIGFALDTTDLDLEEAEQVRQKIISKLKEQKIFNQISIVLTSTKRTNNNIKDKIHIDNVKNIIVIAAGKGGVGKSTLAVLLAHKLVALGKNVGIIDADIYGPSIPNMLNIRGKPKIRSNQMLPLENYKIQSNSIGFITAPQSSVSWRGPMVSKALYQLLSLTCWNNLDYLIIDTPPGTGDIHLSLLQNYTIDKIIMISTPQKIAEIDVSRSINLYKKFNVPIMGIIENMSYYTDPVSNRQTKIFTGNGAETIAKKHNIPILATLPIIPGLSAACDTGSNLHKFTHWLDFDF